jgi:dephospho-CoA kinase
MILAFIGEKLGGKDAVTKYLIENHNAVQVKYSEVLDEILEILDIERSRKNETALAMGLRDLFGKDVLVPSLKNKISKLSSPLIIMNGVRFQEELEAIKDLEVKSIYITAPQEIRYQRYLKRVEKTDDGTKSFEDFQKEDQNSPTEVNIPGLGSKADHFINNTGSLEELYSKVDKLLQELNK